MSSLRAIAIGLGLLFLVPLVIGIGVAAWTLSGLPPKQGDRIRGPHGLVGVQTNGSYAWVIPSETGVVLVDAGLEPEARALIREIGQRPIQAVLLTHGHGEQVGGLRGLGNVPVHAAAADIALIRGEREPRGWMARAFSAVLGQPIVGGALVETADHEKVVIDGIEVLAVHVPGHTDGSVAWLWDDVLFTGDAVLGGAPLSLAPAALADDPVLAEQSLDRLLPLDFDAIADGHVGLTGTARPALFRLAGERLVEPTISVRQGGERRQGTVAERTGVYVETPVPDVRGERPVFVVFDDTVAWRIGDAPVPGREDWANRQVVVRGRILPGAGPGIPVEVESIVPSDAPPSAPGALSSRVGQWVDVQGKLQGFRPLSRGAAWGEGTLVLPDDTSVPLSAPIDVSLTDGADVHLLARVAADGSGVRLVAAPPDGSGGAHD